jgi:short-subunit dehydrogenase
LTKASPSRDAPSALITGASVGIGLELARLLARGGHRLLLVARDEPKLNAVAAELLTLGAAEARVIPADLSIPNICEKIAAGNEIDILINNAGFGVHGSFAQSDLQKQIDLIQVNITALTHLTHLFLPAMLRRRRGMIMNVASVAGFVPGPLMATYYASKAYVVSFSLALAEECRGCGVTITALCPGPTRTEFFKRAGMGRAPLAAAAMSAQTVARIGYRDMLKGRPLSVTGWSNKLLVAATRLAPRMLLARVAAARNRRR